MSRLVVCRALVVGSWCCGSNGKYAAKPNPIKPESHLKGCDFLVQMTELFVHLREGEAAAVARSLCG